MPEVSLAVWIVGVAALIVGILAGHFGWGKRWPGGFGASFRKLHPDYLAGLDYLVTEQPDRALDMFLRLMDASADTLETHFALGALYRRRGEVERAIRIHQNLLAREHLAAEHREQALLALAQDYLRAGLLDRAEKLFHQVSEVARLRASALDALRGIYELQREWQPALDAYRQLAKIGAAPPPLVAGHYLCELASLAIGRGDVAAARRLLRSARGETAPFPRAALLRASIAEAQGETALAVRLVRRALDDAPKLMHEELPHLLSLVGEAARDAVLEELVQRAEFRDLAEVKRLVFAAIASGAAAAAPLRSSLEKVFLQDPVLRAVRQAEQPAPSRRQLSVGQDADAPGTDLQVGDLQRLAREIGALMSQAEKYRCNECGFAARNFYWHCPACQAWDSFEGYAVVNLR